LLLRACRHVAESCDEALHGRAVERNAPLAGRARKVHARPVARFVQRAQDAAGPRAVAFVVQRGGERRSDALQQRSAHFALQVQHGGRAWQVGGDGVQVDSLLRSQCLFVLLAQRFHLKRTAAESQQSLVGISEGANAKNKRLFRREY